MNRLAGFVPMLSHLARLGVVGGAALALVASTEAGDRADDGTCPAGETCSPDTPDGLLFEGAPLGTWPALTAHTIATGGRETFRITFPGAEPQPFDLPFTAKVTGDGRSILGAGADRVTVAAATTTTGYLRILDPGGQLYDRLSIDSAPVVDVRAFPTYAAAYPVFSPPQWAAFAGGQATVAVALEGPDGQSVVDEDLVMRTPVPSVRTSWDSFTLTTAGAGTVLLSVDAGDVADREVRVSVVDAFDELAISAPSETGVGGDLTVCFAAWRRGPAPDASDDTLVIGVPRQYRVKGPATPLATQEYPSCVQLRTSASGTVRVDATVGARTWSATVDVRGSGAREVGDVDTWLRAPSEGERAALTGD